jgi:isohexenylglutaconyl-CoA hydratase
MTTPNPEPQASPSLSLWERAGVRAAAGGACVTVTLDSPTTRNALTDAMVAAIQDAITHAEANPTTRALIIRGAGHTFCAGGDFSNFRALMAAPAPASTADPIATFNRAFGAMLERLHACAVPTIAVVEGAAMGGGCGLAAACDFVIASSTAQFGMPEVTLGLPPAQIAPFVAARLGSGPALRLMLTGRRLGAAQALDAGLADSVAEPTDLDAQLQALLTDLGRAEPAALRATKAIVQRRQHAALADTLDFAATQFAASLRSGTAAEGIAALTAKRPARWVVREATLPAEPSA